VEPLVREKQAQDAGEAGRGGRRARGKGVRELSFREREAETERRAEAFAEAALESRDAAAAAAAAAAGGAAHGRAAREAFSFRDEVDPALHAGRTLREVQEALRREYRARLRVS
jgi:hypothetical protein